MSNFPILSKKESPSMWEITLENSGMKSETDGGYKFTRPRHTRRPRRTFTTGWQDVSQTDYALIESFYNLNGTFQAFNYVNYMNSDELVNVRFVEPPQFPYQGIGTTRRYDIKVKLEEV